MKSWKKLVALLGVVVLLGSMGLMRISYGPILHDPEYELALDRADRNTMPGAVMAREYPFTSVTRVEAVAMYIRLAQLLEMLPVRSVCDFFDINSVTQQEQQNILLACQYGFFQGSGGSFEPESYLTKGTSMVALMRGLFPAREFAEEKEFRLPYIELGNELGIITREPGPYVNYLITRYELLLQLYRAYQLRK